MPLRIAKSGASIATFRIIDIDNDAFNFLTAAGITNTTQRNAINKLVIDLKYYGLWTKQRAIYPVVGGVAASHAVNLKTPGTYNLTFTAGWTHSSTGMTPLNAYADTGFNPSITNTNNNHISFYSRTNINESSVDMGIYSSAGGGTYFDIESRISDVAYFGNHVANIYASFSNTNSTGFYINTRTSNNLQKIYKNNVFQIQQTSTTTGGLDGNIYIGTRNRIGLSIINYSTKQCAFASIGDGLTDTDALNFYNIVQRYQTNLSRQV